MRYLTPDPLNILDYINHSDVKYTTKIITSDYTVQATDDIIICKNFDPIQITLPIINENIKEKLFIIYKAGNGSITIIPNQNNSLFLDSDNSNLISFNIPGYAKKFILLIAKDNSWHLLDLQYIPFNISQGKYGYVCGGDILINSQLITVSTIDRFQFPFDSGNAIYVGNLSGIKAAPGANNSSIHGYICGGWIAQNQVYLSIIDRFQFPFDSGNAIRIGNLSGSRSTLDANNSSIHGYVCGGYNGSSYFSTIDRFQFPFDSGNAIYVGNLSGSRRLIAANNSSIHGYVCGGGEWGGPYFSIIDRFQFPFDSGNAIYVGNLSGIKAAPGANNSSIHGYICGGYNNNLMSIIDRFQFPFDSGNAIYIGNLSGSRLLPSANNSSIHGYICGGSTTSSSFSMIDRFQFPFDSGNAIYVGNLSGTRHATAANDDTFIPNVMY